MRIFDYKKLEEGKLEKKGAGKSTYYIIKK